MGRKRKELPEIKDVVITGIAAEGKSFAKVKLKDTDDSPLVVFIPYGCPGDIVNIKIDKKKNKYAEAHIIDLVDPSPLRIAPKCEHFGVCGGCKWQLIPYEEQLKFKRQQVVDALTRIAKVEIPEVPMTLGSEKIWAYRNKMEYTFSNKKWRSWEEIRGEKPFEDGNNALGFHIPGSYDKVLQINKCWLQGSLGDKVRNFLYSYVNSEKIGKLSGLIEAGKVFFDIKENEGFLRNLIIRNTTTGELMVCLVFGVINNISQEKFKEACMIVLEDLVNEIPEINTLLYVINQKQNDSIADQEVEIYKGKGYIEEKMGDLTYRISPKSFYQTNSLQAEVLYNTVIEFAGLSESYKKNNKPLVYDLYTGAGTIANFVAKNSEKVIGIEYVEDAIKDARINSELNGIFNTEFYAGDMKDVLTKEFIKKHGAPELMIVDPPRAGMHEDVVTTIMNAEPKVIVYVSCNPATQARDIALMDKKYKVTGVQPVDMFPHTHHVENVVKLELRDEFITN